MGLDMQLYIKPRDSSDMAQFADPSWHSLAGSAIADTVVAAQWRKNNCIHQWFVNHVQDGKDDCETQTVSREKLVELKSVCESLIAARGSSEVDCSLDDYSGMPWDHRFYEALQQTRDRLEVVLAHDLEYSQRGSW